MRNTKPYSFKLDPALVERLRKAGREDQPPVPLTYLVALSITEYLVRLGHQQQRVIEQDGPRRSPLPPAEAMAAPADEEPTALVEPLVVAKERKVRKAKPAPALVNLETGEERPYTGSAPGLPKNGPIGVPWTP